MFLGCRLAAAQEAAAQAEQQQAGVGAADRMGGASAAGGQGPSSLFLLSEENPIRRYTRFIIEWPYPFSYYYYYQEFSIIIFSYVSSIRDIYSVEMQSLQKIL